MKAKQMYATPVVKTFKVSLESNCCQSVSPLGGVPPVYPGSGLGEDFDFFEF